MTEIPEHLLKRSRDRKTPEGGGDAAPAEAQGTSDAPASTPAATTPSAPTLAARPPESKIEKAPPPDPPFVAAAKSRKRVPMFVLPVLAFLPVWALLYANTLDVKEAEAQGLLPLGAEVYQSCASCHGPSGGGGVGPQLSAGEVLKTFPTIEDQIAFVSAGSKAGEPYGAADREGGQRVGSGGMPPWGGSLTEEQLKAVACHERVTLAGGDEPSCTDSAAGGGE